MNRPDRRTLLQFLALGGIASAILARPAAAANVLGNSLISPPAGTMLFRRQLTRSTVGSDHFVVTRDFRLQFSRFADGYVVEGHQVASEVSAPEELAVFARLERERVETGLFPLVLDPFGKIGAQDSPAPSGSEIERAMALAIRQLAIQPIADGERTELQNFVSALQQSAANITSALPEDLFAPAQPARSENHDIDLPTGDVGRLITRFEAERDTQSGLMKHAKREVVTQIGTDQRRTVEEWHLLPSDNPIA